MATPHTDVLLPLCGRCGVVAPSERGHCVWCEDGFAEPAVRVRTTRTEPYWVAVQCQFDCRACGFKVPLDALDTDGAVECGHCGLTQHFDPDVWTNALAFAHSVGDLGAPAPEGRTPHATIWVGDKNPHRLLGETTGVAAHAASTEAQSFQMEAGPGHPVCVRCSVPLDVSHGEEGVVETQCAACGDRDEYALPSAATAIHRGLKAVVAPEHHLGRAKAKLETVAGKLVTLRCPGCAGGLTASTRDVVECAFCGMSVWIPRRARVHDSDTPPEPTTWWLCFEGVSDARLALEETFIAKTETERLAKEAQWSYSPLKELDVVPGHPILQWVTTLSMLAFGIAGGFAIAAWLGKDFLDVARSLLP
jgi:hypothetical protein